MINKMDAPTPPVVDSVATAYAIHLQTTHAAHRGYHPCFSVTSYGGVQKAHRRRWHNTCVEIGTDWRESYSRSLKTCSDFSNHYAMMLQDARRKTEVSVHTMTQDERKQMTEAKKLEADQWISNTVFTVAKRAGIPKNRIMSMRWILTWKKVEHASPKAKARLVVKGFTDPDLITLRAESPTLSRIARNSLLQLAASYKMHLSMGDVKTAFLQGDRTAESARDVYGDIPAADRGLFGLTHDDVIKLEGSVYGLRTAPKAWFTRVATDLKALGAKQHPLDQCVFMFYSPDNTLLGALGV